MPLRLPFGHNTVRPFGAGAWPRTLLTVLTLLLAALGSAPHTSFSAGSASPVHHCRGSTRARVPIAWPTAHDHAIDHRLPFHHVPADIRRWGYLIVPTARRYHVDPYLIAGVIQMESNGDPLAWNLDSDARGLMQVLHASFQPADNIRLGVSMLAGFLAQYHRLNLALAAYNAGPGYVQEYNGVPPFPETRDYIVMVRYFRDHDAGRHLSLARRVRFEAALHNLIAVSKRLCG
ncbi:MAG TPA: transglycosylase SLT domain-containing protein [Chloroflexota bacterium]|nr:transglycosylase SLT domain-containing protein [Chloroflexota bacterium]